MNFTRVARHRNNNGIDRVISGYSFANRRRFRESVRRRTLVLEPLESRALLTVAQDLAGAISSYQPALTSALNAATYLPLVRNQLTGLSEFATALQNTEANINSQTQNITANGHYQVSVPLPSLSKTFSFDLGLDAFLKAAAVGNVHAEIRPTLTIGFDVTGGAASLDVGQTRFDIGFGLSLPGFQGTFSLNGLLFTEAVDAGTSFNGDLGFQFTSGGTLNPQFSGEAHVLLALSMSFVDPALNASFNPTFRTTLDVDWGFDANNQLAAPNISLVNMGLEADGFLHGFLGDVVKTAQKFTKPIQPFIDVFQTPVPILSAFDSSETIGTLMLKGAGTSPAQQDSFKLMVQIINAVNSIDLSGTTGGAVIPFGTITVTGNPQQAGGFGFNTSAVTTAIDDIIDIPALQTVESALRKVGNYTATTSTAGFQFPLLEHPGPVIAGILLGQPDTTLFSFSTGRQHFELAPSIGVGIPGVLGLFLEAGINFDANLTMGYDTAGLLAYPQSPNVNTLLHGFYFDNSIDTSVPAAPGRPPVRKTGLYLQGQMDLKADALLAHASGGLYANINVELVNTDSTNHVHLDTMIGNLTSGGKVFKLGGKLYASADVSLALSLPIGPDITLFSFNLAHEELLNFDPAPAPSGVPIRVFDAIDQHTLSLDVNKMTAGSVITVQPFHDTMVSGNTFEADGIRVDYPGEIHLYVERKNNANTNYYNLIALNGTAPDGVSINVIDPFRVFADEGASNPSPAQTKPAILLVGGKNVIYAYTEAPDGSRANALLVGGYGSNTLTGGTMTFGNFIPADRIAQAKAHFANTTGFDGAGQGLINSQIDAVMAPANPAGIIGAKMTGSRGGLMMGGPGNNSFIAMGAGVYEMIGGAWVNSFNISPSYSGGPASYQIDGGPGGASSLIVRVPTGDMADFENGTVPDKYNSAFKALDVYSNAGLFATAHGIQKVIALGSPGSTVVIGDTSELDIDIAIRGSGTMKFGGSPQPDVFDVSTRYDVVGFYGYGTRNHRTMAIESRYVNGDVYYLYPGDTRSPNDAGYVSEYQYVYVDGPFYTISRTFGTNNRTQSIELNVGEVNSTSLVLDARGGADQYHVAVGLGSFLDIVIDDTDSTTQNSLLIDSRKLGFINHRAILNDNSLHLEFYTPITAVNYGLGRFVNYMSVSYSPTFYFGANSDVTFAAADPFVETTINRPAAPQNASVLYDGISTGSMIAINYAGPTAYDPEQPNGQLITATSATIDVQANAGMLSLEPRGMTNVGSNPGALLNVYSNSGTLSVRRTLSSADQLGAGHFDTFNILGNTGSISIDVIANLNSGTYLNYRTHVINVLGNAGTINLHDALYPGIIAYGADAQVNVGDSGSLANVHGTISLSHAAEVLSTTPNDVYSIAGRYGLMIDDRDNPGPGRQWMVNASGAVLGDLAIDFANVNTQAPYLDTFSKLQLYPNPGSTVAVTQQLPFYRQEVHGTGGSNTLIGPDFDTFWSLTGIDSGFISMVLPYQRELSWDGMQILVGGLSNDTFVFAGGSVTGLVSGGDGFNTLHYNLPPTPFIVDLANGNAPLVGGTVSNIQSVFPDTNEEPTLSINSVGLAEGNNNAKSFVFTVTLSFDPTDPVKVTVNTTDGTATLAGGDYEAISTLVLSFQRGDPLTQTVTVPVYGDATAEPDEMFFVDLSGATGAVIANGRGAGTILNDDDAAGLPTLRINNVALAEGNSVTTALVFTVSLSFDPTSPVLVTVNSADGTATLADNDYQAITNLVLTFNPGGPLAQTVTVLVNGDTKSEPVESLLVILSGAMGATIATSQGTGTILDDDASTAPTLSIAGPAAGVRAQTLSFSFTVNAAPAGFVAGGAALANLAAGFSIAINWGDGQNQTIVLAPGEAARSHTHTYRTTGPFTVTATAADEFGQVGDAATYQVSIAAVGLMPDPSVPGKMSLFVGGTPGNDSISIVASGRRQVQVKINGKNQGKFAVTSGLFVYGGAGNDTLSVAPNIKLPALLDGGLGSDILLGGGGNDILLGGEGNDRLFGRAGRELLIGGGGADRLSAVAKGDILIGSTTAFDAHYESLRLVMAEWTSGRNYKSRTANLRGSVGGGGANRSVRLVTAGPESTILDDGAQDLLRGGAGQDWFFAELSGAAKNKIIGHRAGELIERKR